MRIVRMSLVVVCLGILACGPSGEGGDGTVDGDASTNGGDSVSVADATDDDIDASCEVHRDQWDDVDDDELHDVVCRAIGIYSGWQAAEEDSGDTGESPQEVCDGERSFCDSHEPDEFLEQSGWGEIGECEYDEFFDQRRDEVLEQCDLVMEDFEKCSEEQRDGFDAVAREDYGCEVFDDGELTDEAAESAVLDIFGGGDTCNEIDECDRCFDDEIVVGFDGEEASCHTLCSDEEDCEEGEDCVSSVGGDVCRKMDE